MARAYTQFALPKMLHMWLIYAQSLRFRVSADCGVLHKCLSQQTRVYSPLDTMLNSASLQLHHLHNGRETIAQFYSKVPFTGAAAVLQYINDLVANSQ